MSDPERLIGHWRLLDFSVHFAEGESVRPLGARPFGLLIYLPGWMSAHLVAEGAAQSYFSYCGRWHVEDGLAKHEVLASDIPGWIGRVLTRGIEWDGEILVLTARHVPPGGRKGEGRLRWERQGPALVRG